MCFFKIVFLVGGRRGVFPANVPLIWVSPSQIQVHPHFCTQDEAQKIFKQTLKRPGETESFSCLWYKSVLCWKWRAELTRGSRNNNWQGTASTDAGANSDCSFHQFPNRTNNTGIVLNFIEGLWRGSWLLVGNWQSNPSPEEPHLILLQQTLAFGIRVAKPLIPCSHQDFSMGAEAPLEPNKETNTKVQIGSF